MSLTIGPGITLGAGVRIDPVYEPVSTGLQVYLDAADYTGSGTTWTAQVGPNATLINAPAWNSATGYFDFVPASLQYAELPNIGDLSSWTVECWYQLTNSLATTAATAAVTTVYDDGEGGFYGVINYCLGNNSVGLNSPYLQAGFFDGAWHEVTNAFAPTIGQWYQSVGTYDGSLLTQYTNGVQAAPSVSVSATTTANGAPIRIARRWDAPVSPEHYFPGYIAIVRIYNTPLNNAEVLQNFNANKTRFGL